MSKRSCCWLQWFAAVALMEVSGYIDMAFVTPALPVWYGSLPWAAVLPANWVFATVWIVLMALLGTAVCLVWMSGGRQDEVKNAVELFLLEVVVSKLWTVMFFGYQSMRWSLVVIVISWFIILAMMAAFFPLSRRAGWLVVPYFLWATFTVYLNADVWYKMSRMREAIEPVACTMDAMQCPDGSYVGRSGPRCEFAPCPQLP